MDYRTKNQAGFSVIEVMVALFCVGLVVVAVASVLGRGVSVQAKSSLDLDREAIQRMITSGTVCSYTLNFPSIGQCVPNADGLVLVRGRDASGAPVVLVRDSDPPTRFGRWALRASCHDSGSINVYIARLKAGASITSNDPADFDRDPMTGKVSTFTAPESNLLPTNSAPGPGFCGGTASGLECIQKQVRASPNGYTGAFSAACPVGYLLTGCTYLCSSYTSRHNNLIYNADGTCSSDADGGECGSGPTVTRDLYAMCCRFMQ